MYEETTSRRDFDYLIIIEK